MGRTGPLGPTRDRTRGVGQAVPCPRGQSQTPDAGRSSGHGDGPDAAPPRPGCDLLCRLGRSRTRWPDADADHPCAYCHALWLSRGRAVETRRSGAHRRRLVGAGAGHGAPHRARPRIVPPGAPARALFRAGAGYHRRPRPAVGDRRIGRRIHVRARARSGPRPPPDQRHSRAILHRGNHRQLYPDRAAEPPGDADSWHAAGKPVSWPAAPQTRTFRGQPAGQPRPLDPAGTCQPGLPGAETFRGRDLGPETRRRNRTRRSTAPRPDASRRFPARRNYG